VALNVSAILLLLFAWLPLASSQTNSTENSSAFSVGTNGALAIHVQTAGGLPVSNVTVVCVDAMTNAVLKGTTIRGGSRRFQTDAEGQFTFSLRPENLFFMVATDTGFGLAQSRYLTNNPVIVVHPWGRIEGTRTNRNHPVANQRIMLDFDWMCLSDDISTRNRVGMNSQATTDSAGRFAFPHVPPVGIALFEVERSKELWDRLVHLEVKPGEDKRIQIATQGRTIVGRLESRKDPPDDLDLKSCDIYLVPASHRHGIIPAVPEEFDIPDKRTTWWQDWYNSEVGQREFPPLDKQGSALTVQSNGYFTSDIVVAPGKYWVTGSLRQNGNKVAKVDQYIEIPSNSDATDASFDAGKITLKPSLQAGNIAPDLDLRTLDRKSLRLSDFHGKYVLLEFWATWCGPCLAEMPNLKSVYGTFGNDRHFAMISLSLNEDAAAPKAFVRDRDIRWTQVFLGDWGQDTVTKALEISSIPSIWLIGPDGKIISRSLRGPKIREAVASALGK
jgi:thiol-disulfide isomerase/thioredoxin